MAEYATVAQAVELYGEDVIAVACDRNQDGIIDISSFEKQLRIASRTMNGYFLGRVSLPMANPPENLQKYAIDIAIYNGCPTADKRTEEMRLRFKDAIDYLTLVATGKVKLELDTDTTAANKNLTAQTQTHSQVAVISGSERRFRRDTLKGLL